ncbi:MAG: leucyl aminopeptidase family protein [Cytophagaceae bacterium]
MKIQSLYIKSITGTNNLAYIISSPEDAYPFLKGEGERKYLNDQFSAGKLIHINLFDRQLFFITDAADKSTTERKETFRRLGYKLYNSVQEENINSLQLSGTTEDDFIIALFEGFVLSSYNFDKYKKPDKNFTCTVEVCCRKDELFFEVNNILKGVFKARDLVNEPVLYLTAEQLSEELKSLANECSINITVFDKAKIKELGMGGLIAVNMGSPNPPTFNIMEYKPLGHINSKPYVLIGKGVVFDTGGLSLKPTTNSMDLMKCDMAGAAATACALYAIALNKLPYHIICVIPATENRPDGNAVTPGDVIKISDGTTVEVLNTDAEGRLILADALVYAARWNPELVIDLATLTGAAARAIGKEGIVYMGTASDSIKQKMEAAGKEVYERLVEFPLWDEYKEYIKSDIADLKNIGGSDAGAITAGKFLEHFVKYPWLHLDIAGSAFLMADDSYRKKNGTGTGVRLLYNFFKNLSKN